MKKVATKQSEIKPGSESSNLPRRDFFKLLGAGIIVFFRPWGEMDLLALPGEQARTISKDYNAFLSIAEDGTVLLGPPAVFDADNIDDFDF